MKSLARLKIVKLFRLKLELSSHVSVIPSCTQVSPVTDLTSYLMQHRKPTTFNILPYFNSLTNDHSFYWNHRNCLKLQEEKNQLLSRSRLASSSCYTSDPEKVFDKRDQGTYPPPFENRTWNALTSNYPLNSPWTPMHCSRLQKRAGHRII
jgi:hypothetical protein